MKYNNEYLLKIDNYVDKEGNCFEDTLIPENSD